MKPNLVYMFADQLRLCSTGYAGDTRAKTPNLDCLSQEGLDLCNAISGHPVCAPYRASLFTGKYTTSTGMVINEIRINRDHETFADVLNKNGYETAYIGKWHLYANELGNHYDPKNSYIPKGRDRLGFNGLFASYNFHHENYGENSYYHLDSPQKLFWGGYEPDAQTDMAIGEIKKFAEQGKPFALFLSIGTPHDPWEQWNVPTEYYEMFRNVKFGYPENYGAENDPHADDWARLSEEERRALPEWMRVYYAMIANVDKNAGRVLEAINECGIAENTIFIFTSDHGEMFGAHGRRAKNIFYEEAVRIPFLIKWGDRLPRGKNDVCLNTVDIMPTLLHMMGIEQIPSGVEGRDLSGCLFGCKDTEEPFGALMQGTGATAIFEDGHEWRGYRTKEYTYAVYLADGEEHLYHNISDSLQQHNLAQDPNYRNVKERLCALMHKEMERVHDRFRPSSYYVGKYIKDRKILFTSASETEESL